MNEYNKAITYRHKSIKSPQMKVPLYSKNLIQSQDSSIKYYKAIYFTLSRQYSMKQKNYIAFQIENLIQNKRTHNVAVFKDQLIYYYKIEYCKRYYKRKESLERIPKFTNYYKNYLRFFCKATFSDFKINVIIQGYGKRSAQLYYDQYYSKKRNDNKNKSNKDKNYGDHLNVFSPSVRDNINKNNSINESSIVQDQKRKKRNKCNKETDESTLQLTCINNNKSREEGLIINIDNESIMSIVNLFDNNIINTDSNKEYCQTTTCDTTTQALKIIRNCKGKLKKLIEEKSLSSNNKAKLKLKANLNPQSDQIIKLVTNLNKKQFNKEVSINNKQSKGNHPKMVINAPNNNNTSNTQELKRKYRHERNAISIIPTINTIEGTRETVSRYTSEYPVINTHQYVESNKCFSPFVLSSKTITHSNQLKENRNIVSVNDKKKMALIHVKTNSIEANNEIESRNIITKISHRPVLSFSNVFSSYNNYNKQQRQLKHNNYLTMSKGRTISISKEIRKHNSRYTITNNNTDQFSTIRQHALLNNRNKIQKTSNIIQKHSLRKTKK